MLSTHELSATRRRKILPRIVIETFLHICPEGRMRDTRSGDTTCILVKMIR